MTVIDEFIPNRNQYGAITDTGGTSDNDILWSSIYAVIISNTRPLGDAEEDELQRLRWVICQYLTNEGMTKRRPDSGGCDAPDNLNGWVVLSVIIEPKWAQAILAYIRANGGIWPGPEPEIKRWLGRFKGIVTALQVAAGERPQYDDQFWFVLGLLVSAFRPSTDQDNSIQGHLVTWAMWHATAEHQVPFSIVASSGLWRLVMWLRGVTMKHTLTSFGPGWFKFAEHF